jgi:hypothetical protein
LGNYFAEALKQATTTWFLKRLKKVAWSLHKFYPSNIIRAMMSMMMRISGTVT